MTQYDIREMRRIYLESIYRCAYCETVPRNEYKHCQSQNLFVEHVWQRLSKKIDHVCNYVPSCHAAHEWKHANTVLGRLAALYWKQKHNEFDRETLRELIGRDPVGWVSNQLENGLPEWADELARSILENY